jgi:ubiquinone/menaquinone biosynthesis C-methylase UbiE
MGSTRVQESAQEYWDKTAEVYDQVFAETLVGQAQRDSVWRELTRTFHRGQRLLELNCGTGIDAVHLARGGVQLVACDISPRMIGAARKRADAANVSDLIDFRVLPTEQIDLLPEQTPFDGVFSNFSGLNCVEDQRSVARNLARILKPGSRAVFCMVGSFALWESGWHAVHGNVSLALKRFRRSDRGTGSTAVRVHYPSVDETVRAFAPHFRLITWKGVGVAIPPSCLEPLAQGFPGFFARMASVDAWFGRVPGIRAFGDCVVLQFEHLGR